MGVPILTWTHTQATVRMRERRASESLGKGSICCSSDTLWALEEWKGTVKCFHCFYCKVVFFFSDWKSWSQGTAERAKERWHLWRAFSALALFALLSVRSLICSILTSSWKGSYCHCCLSGQATKGQGVTCVRPLISLAEPGYELGCSGLSAENHCNILPSFLWLSSTWRSSWSNYNEIPLQAFCWL